MAYNISEVEKYFKLDFNEEINPDEERKRWLENWDLLETLIPQTNKDSFDSDISNLPQSSSNKTGRSESDESSTLSLDVEPPAGRNIVPIAFIGSGSSYQTSLDIFCDMLLKKCLENGALPNTMEVPEVSCGLENSTLSNTIEVPEVSCDLDNNTTRSSSVFLTIPRNLLRLIFMPISFVLRLIFGKKSQE